jgi:guanylate kinase
MPFHFAVSMTTRPARPGEEEGVDYHFVDEAQFEKARKDGRLVEWAEYGGNLYGTPVDEVEGPRGRGDDVLLDIEMVGARNVKASFPEAILIFVLPPSLPVLEERLRMRHDTSDEAIAARVALAEQQIAEAQSLFDHFVVNDDLASAVDAVADILGHDPSHGAE